MLAWNSAEHGRASKAAAKMKALMGLISVILLCCVTSDFQSMRYVWAACLLDNITVLVEQTGGKMSRFFQVKLEKKQIGSKEMVIFSAVEKAVRLSGVIADGQEPLRAECISVRTFPSHVASNLYSPTGTGCPFAL